MKNEKMTKISAKNTYFKGTLPIITTERRMPEMHEATIFHAKMLINTIRNTKQDIYRCIDYRKKYGKLLADLNALPDMDQLYDELINLETTSTRLKEIIESGDDVRLRDLYTKLPLLSLKVDNDLLVIKKELEGFYHIDSVLKPMAS